jgi:hypothetical protein
MSVVPSPVRRVLLPVVPTVRIVATGYVAAGPLLTLFGSVRPVGGLVDDYRSFAPVLKNVLV